MESLQTELKEAQLTMRTINTNNFLKFTNLEYKNLIEDEGGEEA
jgi:hypothetical protein